MSRPSNTYQGRPVQRSSSSTSITGSENMHGVPTYSPTPSTSQQVFYPSQGYFAQPNQPGPSYQMSNGQDGMNNQGHANPQGRMALPFNGGVVSINPNSNKRAKTPTPSPSADTNCGPSPFLPEDEISYGDPANLPPNFDQNMNGMQHNGSQDDMHYHQTPLNHHIHAHHLSQNGLLQSSPDEMGPPGYILSPTDQMRMQQQHHMQHLNNGNNGNSNGSGNGQQMSHPAHHQGFPPDQLQPRQRPASQGRPMLTHRHTMQEQSRPPHLQRQMSLQQQQHVRSASPHIAGDIFDPLPSPHLRPSSSMGFVENHAGPSGYHDGMTMEYEYQPQMDNGGFYSNTMQGISPARALGPAPPQPIRFSPHNHEYMQTPQNQQRNGYSSAQSSATSSTATTQTSTSGSNFSSGTVRGGQQTSDDENDSPTKGLAPQRVKRMPIESVKVAPIGQVTKVNLIARPRPAPTSMGAGRTSAKFAKVADDPGVEGIPPGPRPMDRPGPSFACIIGQAILKCKAGGLSLEHIYRYVETAYPFFKTGDGAWRNSVRHNLSIHKMFETIPRTEMFPAGKGGIWIIHEEEKCHWPEDNKFIKNFPASHPHHASCRQTLHERQKEQEAIDRAAREGRAYIPKKGKKGRKLNSNDDDDEGMEMVRSSSSLGERPSSSIQLAPRAIQPITNQPLRMHAPPQRMQNHPLNTQIQNIPQQHPSNITPIHHHLSLHSSDFEDDGDFLPLDSEYDHIQLTSTLNYEDRQQSQPVLQSSMSRYDKSKPPKRRPTADEDIENVFTAPKRVRVAEPLSQILPHPQERLLPGLDDSYVTPERAGINQQKTMSSAFKTPALIQTSSSPGSSPMPPSIQRGPHHPSTLQQAWTHDDLDPDLDIDINPSSPPASRQLESAFDLKPLGPMLHSRPNTKHLIEEDTHILPNLHNAPPKTPVTRSSAATEKTPRLFKTPGPLSMSLGLGTKTPAGYASSPGMGPPSASQFLSTPLWEIHNCLSRLERGGNFGSPTRSPSGRNSVPSTSPTRYAMLLPSVDGSPARKV